MEMIGSSMLLGQMNFENITNWMTPVWLISVGISIGFLLVIAMTVVLFILGKIPGLNSLGNTPQGRMTFGSILSVICGAGLLVYLGYSFFSMAQFQGLETQAERNELFGSQYLVWVLLAVVAAPVMGFGLVSLTSAKRGGELLGSLGEGFLKWMTGICLFFIAFAVIGYGLGKVNGFGILQFVDEPDEKLESIGRLPYCGEFKQVVTVEPTPRDADPELQPISFYGFELDRVQFLSDQRLLVSVEALPAAPTSAQAKKIIEISAGSDRTNYFKRGSGDQVFPDDMDAETPVPDKIEGLYIRNMGRQPAEVTVWWNTQPLFPETRVVPIAAASVFGVFLFYLLFAGAMPKVAAISMSTFKNEISQPIFILLVVLGMVFITGMIFLPFYTLGEDIKMYKEGVLTFIRVLAIFLAIWSASKSVAEEIEGRTALTVLSKPVGRRQFIVGKFSGISFAVGLLFILLGLWFIVWVSWKPIYDGKEMASATVEWRQSFEEAMRIIPGLLLGFMEVAVFVAISVAISTRLGILPNFLICFSVYVLGHLTPLIVQSNEVAELFQPVQVFGRVIATIVPVLDHFDIQAAIMGENVVPLDYIGWCTVYCLMYGAMALLFALVLFEDRDLA